jgi:predicted transcriptional regulator
MTHKDLTQGKKVKTHLMLTQAINDELDRRRERQGVSRSWTARQALADYLSDKNILNDLVRWYEAELERINDALESCGIGGIYAEFDGAADAIQQMSQYIKEAVVRVPIVGVLDKDTNIAELLEQSDEMHS